MNQQVLSFLYSQLTASYVDGINLENTPGFIYGISYIMSACIYCMTNPRLRTDRISYVKRIGFASLFLIFIIMTHGVPKYIFLLFAFTEFCGVCFQIWLGCDMNTRNVLFFGIRAYILGEFAASLEWQIFYYVIIQYNVPLNPYTQTASILVTFGVIYTIAYMIEARINSDQVHLHVEKEEVVAAFTIGVLIYAISNLSYLDFSSPFTTDSPFELLMIRTIVDAAGILMLSMYYLMIREAHARIEAVQMQTILKMQYANYELSKQSMDLVNQKYHDLKHQIALLRSETEEGKQKYLDQLTEEIQSYETMHSTENEVLDAIVSNKSRQCQKENIQFTIVADGKELSFMNPMDLSSIFGNLLDNAIEAVEKVDDPEKRRIHLTVSRKKDFLHITCENNFNGQLEIRHGLPITSKRDNYYHGFGIKSIQKIAEKYNGTMTIHTQDGCFIARILIPLS